MMLIIHKNYTTKINSSLRAQKQKNPITSLIFLQTWTVSLCNADSDGDGVANGVELGDPDCVWTQGMSS